MTEAVRLGLGGAQFGMDYGVANAAGKVPAAELRLLLDDALAAGIGLIDTAPAYGDSEAALGASGAADGFEIVTKTDAADPGPLEQQFAESLRRLGRASVYGLLLHHGVVLTRPGGARLWDAMSGLRARGLVRKIGVSVYSPGELESILQTARPDLVQVPSSPLDQRFAAPIADLRRQRIETHGRSLFLQGLLPLGAARLPARFARLRQHLAEFERRCAAAGLSPLEGCLAWALSPQAADRTLVGVTGRAELAQILGAIPRARHAAPDFAGLALADETLINPAKWERRAS